MYISISSLGANDFDKFPSLMGASVSLSLKNIFDSAGNRVSDLEKVMVSAGDNAHALIMETVKAQGEAQEAKLAKSHAELLKSHNALLQEIQKLTLSEENRAKQAEAKQKEMEAAAENLKNLEQEVSVLEPRIVLLEQKVKDKKKNLQDVSF